MGEYGSGMSFASACAKDKERIRHALAGELLCGETENGFVYAKASREECEAYILSAYDECVYQARQAMAAGRALERAVRETLVDPREYDEAIRPAYRQFRDEEDMADYNSDDYHYENEDEDDDTVEDLEGGEDDE